MALRPLTEEELRAGAVAINRRPSRPIKAGTPDAEQMTHTRPGPPSDPPPAAPAKPAAKPPHAGRQAPPEVVARKPGPPPAQVAADVGTAAPAAPASVPRETPGVAPAEAPADEAPKDMHAFYYRDQVEAMERKAMELGRPEEAARVRAEYNRLIDGQFRSMETDYRTKTLPQVQAIQSQLLKFQGQQLPRELVMKARDTVQQAAEQQQQMLGYLYGLVRNSATKGLGIQYFNQSELIEPGVQLADLIVDENTGMLIGVDANGATVKLSSGQDFAFPIEAAEQLYEQLYGSGKDEVIKLGEGEIAVDRRSRQQIAANPRSGSGTPSDQMTAVKYVRDGIANALGIDLTDTGRMMEGVDQATRDEATRLTAIAGEFVRSGMTPEAAVVEALKQRGSTQPSAASGPGLRELMTGSN